MCGSKIRQALPGGQVQIPLVWNKVEHGCVRRELQALGSIFFFIKFISISISSSFVHLPVVQVAAANARAFSIAGLSKQPANRH